MAISWTHTKVSGKSDGTDATLVQPSDWNAQHTVTMATARFMGRATAGSGAVEEIDITNNTQRAALGFGAFAVKSIAVTADITDLNVTYGKIQNVTNARFLGNFTGGAAPPSEYSLGNGLAVSSTTLNNTALPAGGFQKLAIKVATNTTVAVTADSVSMTDGSGNYRTAAISATCNLGTNAAVNALDTGTIAIDKEYHIWAVSNGSTDGVIASLSPSSPTMPSGYTFKARIGAVMTAHASAILYGTWQFGRRVQYIAGLAGGKPEATATPGPLFLPNGVVIGTVSLTSPTLVSTAIRGNGKYVPSTASHAHIGVFNNWLAGAAGAIMIAPSSAYSGANNGPAGSNKLGWPLYNNTADVESSNFWMMLESDNVYVATSQFAGIAGYVLGWEDNI